MMTRPTGTVAFLFSDIEGSTQRWERDSAAMAADLARHDALMRDAIETHGGYVFKTVGDAFCAAFARTPDALAAALLCQRNLAVERFASAGGILVRMALHSGQAQERDGDYLGSAVNRVARLLAIGHGGQVLVSGTAAELLQEALPSESGLRDLGTHRLRDLARVERVYQLVAPGLRDAFPPPRSLENLPNNLPRQLTSFVGRDEALAEIEAMVRQHHLVTLVGTGGSGKTRCAIQAAAELLAEFPDGVWLVELAPVATPSLVTLTIAQSLGVRETPDRPLLDTLLAHLEERRLLLVLDNCEHVIDEARRVAAAILRGGANARILATSRESLSIAGERAFRLPSLAVPPARDRATAGAALAYGAVALFADRALAADARFALTDENAPLVVEIVDRLDGIPLAIELAAARVKLLSPQQLAQRLDERFRVLTGGDRSALPRQQTLRATIDWSFDLLDDRERALLRRLSVFAGGCTLRAAAEVCADDATDDLEILDTLGSLVDKSLVAADAADAERRYEMLATIREYGGERLAESGEADAIRAKHARCFASVVRELAPLAAALEDVAWKSALAPELDNLRAAIDWTIVVRHTPAVGLALLADLEWPELIATPHEALSWYDAACEAVEETTDPHVHARLLRHRVLLEWLAGVPLAQLEETALRGLAVAREAGDADEIARALANLGACHRSAARFDEAERAFAEAYATPHALSRITANAVLRLWAVTDLQRGNVELARQRFAEVARLERPGSEAHASALLNLGELHLAAGNVAAARETAREATDAYRRLDSVYLVLVLSNVAAYAMAADDTAAAREPLREALALQRASRSGWLAAVLEHHALFAAITGDAERGALLAGFTDHRYSTRGEARQQTERLGYERLMQLLARSYSDRDLASRMHAGAQLSEEEALAHAAAIHEDVTDSGTGPTKKG